jgi:hypothetical protein
MTPDPPLTDECRNCGHAQNAHACTFTALRCFLCGCDGAQGFGPAPVVAHPPLTDENPLPPRTVEWGWSGEYKRDPPATPPLTDEELGTLPDGTPITAFGRHLYRCRHYGWLVGTPSLRDEYDTCPPCDCGLAEASSRVSRLIADLRAARAEAKLLRGERDNWKNGSFILAESNKALDAEVERLRAELGRVRNVVGQDPSHYRVDL